MKYNCLLLTVLALLAGLVCDSAVAQQKGNETDLEETQSGLIGSKNVSNVAESLINKTEFEKNDTVVSVLGRTISYYLRLQYCKPSYHL